MSTKADPGNVKRKAAAGSAKPVPDIFSLGCSGKSWEHVKQLLTPFLQSSGMPVLLAQPVSKAIAAKLPVWLKASGFRIRPAANGQIPALHTLYLTPEGYRSWISENTIVLEKLAGRNAKRADGQLQSVLHELNERVKEQTCLYAISRLITTNPSVNKLLQEALRFIPKGWQYPAQTLAVITLGKQEFRSSRLRKSSWSQSADCTTSEGEKFRLEVFYTKKFPEADEGPFLKSERALLNAIADLINNYIGQAAVNGLARLNEEMLKEAQRLTLQGSWNYDTVSNKLYWSDTIYELFGVKQAGFNKSFGAFYRLVVPDDRKRVMDTMKAARLKGTSFQMEYAIITPAGAKKYMEEYGHCEIDKRGKVTRIFGTVQDITRRKKAAEEQAAELAEKKQKYEVEKLERGVIESSLNGAIEIKQLLGFYISELEKLFPDCKTSLLSVQHNRLHNFWSSSLPASYVAAIEGLETGPVAGSCGTAAHFKKLIIVDDIAHDPLWAKYRKAALASGLKACWSYPVFNAAGEVTATFAQYFSTPRKPSSTELEFFTRAGSLISLMLENHEKEQRLKLSHERFGFVTKATSDAIWDWNLQTNKTFCGDGFSTILGKELSEDQWNLDVWLGHVHPEDRSQIILTVEQTMQGKGIRWEHEYRVKKKDGRFIFVSDRAYIIRNKNGKPVRIIGAIRDITLKREEEQRLRLFEQLVSGTSDAVVITTAAPLDKNGPQMIYVNEAFCRMTGYPAVELIGQTPRILQGQRSDRAELSRLKLALKRGEICEISTINYRKDGKEYRVEMTVKPVFDGQGKLTHFFAIQRDITRQWQLQKQSRLMEIVSHTFKEHDNLAVSLGALLKKLVEFGDFTAAETWLLSPERKKFTLIANFASTSEAKKYYVENKSLNSLTPEGGLLKEIWNRQELIIVDNFDKHPTLRRKEGILKAGFKSALAIPLISKGELIGALTILTDKKAAFLSEFEQLFRGIEADLGAEIRRKQLENELHLIFNTVPDIIAVSGFDGYFKQLNPAAAAILGFSMEELLSRPYSDFLHPDYVPATREVITSLPSISGPGYFENCYLSKSGKPVWLAWTFQPLPEESLVFSVAKDITRQKELQRLLADATQLARIGAWEMDMATRQIIWSEVTREIHEVGPDYEPELEHIFAFYREQDKERLTRCVKEAIEEGIPYDLELLHITARGNEHWVRVIGIPEFTNGRCVRIYGSFQDIHSRKLAEEQLRQSNDRFEKVMQATNDAIWDMDLVNHSVYWGKGFENNFGYISGPEHPDLQSFYTLIHADDREAVRASMRHVIDDPAGEHWQGEFRFRKKDNTYVYVMNRSIILRNEERRPVRIVGSITDITYQKEYEKSLKKLNDDLEMKARDLTLSNAELEQFAYVASHDLQEPLRMITSFLSKLDTKYSYQLDEKARQYISFAVDGARRMRQNILDLLQFSRVGKGDSLPEDIDINEVIEEVRLLHQTDMAECGAVIETGPLPVIHTYMAPVVQVFNNIISNAIKYQKPDLPPRIRVTATQQGNTWEFAISDNGIGIPEEYRQKIFIIFQRLHSKEKYDGTGIGLAVVKKIINNLGGRIWVESAPGSGSTFRFTIPSLAATPANTKT